MGKKPITHIIRKDNLLKEADKVYNAIIDDNMQLAREHAQEIINITQIPVKLEFRTYYKEEDK